MSESARSLLAAMRAANAMHKEMCGILGARGRVGGWSLYDANEQTIADAREIPGACHAVARTEHVRAGYCYDEVTVQVDGCWLAIFSADRPIREGEQVRS